MMGESDVPQEVYDQFKTKMGGEATYCFLFSAPVIVIIQDGWRALISWKTLGFVVVGMFVAAIAFGNIAYQIYMQIFAAKRKQYESGNAGEADIMGSMKSIGCLVSLAMLAAIAVCNWFVWKWLAHG